MKKLKIELKALEKLHYNSFVCFREIIIAAINPLNWDESKVMSLNKDVEYVTGHEQSFIIKTDRTPTLVVLKDSVFRFNMKFSDFNNIEDEDRAAWSIKIIGLDRRVDR